MSAIYFFLFFCGLVSLNYALAPPVFEPPNPIAPAAPSFVINNRPLLRVNGKIISLMDVVKKMDLIIYEHFPEASSSPIRLYQFYSSQWKPTFEDMVFHELTLADGEAKEIKVSDGDVREEMEKRFGPNVISNLNRLNLEYEEVRKMIQDELIVRQLQGMKVYSKAQLSVTPELLKKEYLSYLNKNPPKDEWIYQVVSIRGKDKEATQSFIDQVYAHLKLPSTKLASLQGDFQNLPEIQNKSISVNLSKEFVVEGKNLSEEHKSILTKLADNEFSSPITQISRIDQNSVHRIFYLKSHKIQEATPFHELYQTIENQLLNESAQKEREAYKQKLYKKFGLSSDIFKQILPEDYQPFVVR